MRKRYICVCVCVCVRVCLCVCARVSRMLGLLSESAKSEKHNGFKYCELSEIAGMSTSSFIVWSFFTFFVSLDYNKTVSNHNNEYQRNSFSLSVLCRTIILFLVYLRSDGKSLSVSVMTNRPLVRAAHVVILYQSRLLVQ